MKKILFATALCLAGPAFAGSAGAPVMDPVVIEADAADSSIGGGPTVALVTLAILFAALD